jgi:diaminopimelate decarboxylase
MIPESSKKNVLRLLDETPKAAQGDLKIIVDSVLKKRDGFLSVANRFKTPFYLFDPKALKQSARELVDSFSAILPRTRFFYAMKSNPHPLMLRHALKAGLGLDVSSGQELELALKLGAKDILFTGPGKTAEELELAITHPKEVTLNLDSFRELEKAGALAQKLNTTIRAGIRIYTKYHGQWTKFGIPVEELRAFFDEASAFPGVRLQGIQVHMSWNADAKPYANAISEIAKQLKTLTDSQRNSIHYIDLGGGFLPYKAEGTYSSAFPQGKVLSIADHHYGEETEFKDLYVVTDAIPASEYAQGISEAIHTHLMPLVDCDYYFEPGRLICHKAMHVVLRAEDVKRPGVAILDGGINMIGYERFETDYFPVVNLSQPSDQEIPFKLYGCLCTPYDLWGTSCFAKGIQEGDFLIVPYQGAYTYCLSQPNFIKPVPKVRVLR